jgi:hypothetical protein
MVASAEGTLFIIILVTKACHVLPTVQTVTTQLHKTDTGIKAKAPNPAPFHVQVNS